MIMPEGFGFRSSKKDLEECRMRTGMMVGRDTTSMDYSASGRAAVESLSENLNDGVIAPLFYFILFGIPGMLVYKVVNTLDSMVGYKNPNTGSLVGPPQDWMTS